MTETLEGLSGLERLRELANDLGGVTLRNVLKAGCEEKWETDEDNRFISGELRRIAGMLERERAELLEDSQERIDEDALKLVIEYWGCESASCSRCPAEADGKRPWERYGLDAGSCGAAQKLDLLRRQRELDAREGAPGGEESR